MNKVINFFRESYTELLKVTWPTLPQAIRLTVSVILISVVVGAFLTLLDFGFERGIEKIVSWKNATSSTASNVSTTPIDLGDINAQPTTSQ
jgi:preprotein translocase SecE subunit